MIGKLITVTIIIFLSTADTAHAVKVYGLRDCSHWIEARAVKTGYGAMIEEAWLSGYLAGAVAHDRGGFDPLKNTTSVSQIYLWMDNYCRANPLQNIVDGGNQLLKELIKK